MFFNQHNMSEYTFVTIWKLNAPVEKVWQQIYSSEQWPLWWKGVLKVKILEHGLDNGVGSVQEFSFKSVLPYKISFHSRITHVEYLQRLEGCAFGELDGVGLWTFKENNGLTIVRYDWKVKTTKWWMNLLAPIAKPLFVWNHDILMKRGGQGLAERLGCELIQD